MCPNLTGFSNIDKNRFQNIVFHRPIYPVLLTFFRGVISTSIKNVQKTVFFLDKNRFFTALKIDDLTIYKIAVWLL